MALFQLFRVNIFLKFYNQGHNIMSNKTHKFFSSPYPYFSVDYSGRLQVPQH